MAANKKRKSNGDGHMENMVMAQAFRLGAVAISPDLFERFCSYLDVSKKTVETYRRALRQFAEYLRKNNIQHPTREDILAYKNACMAEHKPTTTNVYLAAVRMFFFMG